jgi:hypothetical protein
MDASDPRRSKGDDVGLRVLVRRRQAVVSTNDVSGDGVAKLAGARRHGAIAPTTNISVLPIRRCWRAFPRLVCSTPRSHRHRSLTPRL